MAVTFCVGCRFGCLGDAYVEHLVAQQPAQRKSDPAGVKVVPTPATRRPCFDRMDGGRNGV